MASDIFISYRRADEGWARLLHRQLKTEGVGLVSTISRLLPDDR